MWGYDEPLLDAEKALVQGELLLHAGADLTESLVAIGRNVRVIEAMAMFDGVMFEVRQEFKQGITHCIITEFKAGARAKTDGRSTAIP